MVLNPSLRPKKKQAVRDTIYMNQQIPTQLLYVTQRQKSLNQEQMFQLTKQILTEIHLLMMQNLNLQ